MTAHDVARRGVALVARELERCGATILPATDAGSRNAFRARLPRGDVGELYVKTRSAGTWQSDIRKGSPSADVTDEDRFWVFVDLTTDPVDFYIAPASWIGSPT